jgi:lysophospholipase L1-like esterase
MNFPSCFRLLPGVLLLTAHLGKAAEATEIASSTPTTEKTTAFVPANDPAFRYEGRFGLSDPAAPDVVWQASRIGFDFEGDSLALRFDGVKDQVYFNAELDGRSRVVELRAGAAGQRVEFSRLGAGPHHLVLFKRSEASAGSARFRGAEIATGAKAFAPPAENDRLKMEFFGDSITAGACNEDGAADQWENRRTHNSALSYGAFVAGAFQADFRDIAVSGMGIATGWTAVKAGEMWDRVYPVASSPRADLATWKPDVLFINLGENDDSFTRSRQQPFPDDAFIRGYVSLVQGMRRAYPAVQIVILRGGMFGGAQSERLRKPWEAVVAELEAADPHVNHFVFTHHAALHPRVSDHWTMAVELIAWLRQQEFMKSRR